MFTIEDLGGGYGVRSDKHKLRLVFDRLREKSGDLSAQIKITAEAGDEDILLCEGDRVNLNSHRSKDDLAKRLASVHKSLPLITWKMVLDSSCVLLLRRYREGEPAVPLTRNCSVEPHPYAVNPIILRNVATLIYASGGTGKSFFGLLLSMLMESGGNIAGLGAVGGRTLYLDWESDFTDLQNRAERIRRGHPQLAAALPLYRRCYVPLSDEIARVQRIVADEKIKLVIIDSVAPACGGELNAPETAIRLFSCVRRLNISVLMIGHPPRQYEQNKDKEQDVFGSTFFRYCGRSLWEAKKVQEAGESLISIGLYHRKMNLGPLHMPLGFRIHFGEAVHFESLDLKDDVELAKGLPLNTRIEHAISGTPKTARDIADELGVDLNQVKVRLSNGKGKRFYCFGDGTWGVAFPGV